jgi:hypothetical protein
VWDRPNSPEVFVGPKLTPRQPEAESVEVESLAGFYESGANFVAIEGASLAKTCTPAIDVGGPITHKIDPSDDDGFICLKKYDGTILRRENNGFWARLQENCGDFPVIEAEFEITELPESDRAIATEGAPIIWTIGYEISGGTRKRQSILYVRRVKAPTVEELKRSVVEIEQLSSAIVWG